MSKYLYFVFVLAVRNFVERISFDCSGFWNDKGNPSNLPMGLVNYEDLFGYPTGNFSSIYLNEIDREQIHFVKQLKRKSKMNSTRWSILIFHFIRNNKIDLFSIEKKSMSSYSEALKSVQNGTQWGFIIINENFTDSILKKFRRKNRRFSMIKKSTKVRWDSFI